MMLVYAPTLAIVTLVAVASYGVLRWAAYVPFRDAAAERLIVSAKENSHFLETVRAMVPIKLFCREDERRVRWQNLFIEVQNRDMRTAKMSLGFSVANSFVFGLENLLVISIGARQIISGLSSPVANDAMTVGMLFAFISYKNQFASRVSGLINYSVELKMLSLHAERLSDICLEAPESTGIPDNDLDHLPACIQLRGVSFRYAEGEPWILKDVDLTIDAGSSLAIVGPSGAGKTTLLKIALGLLKPIEGEVLYGGQKLEHLGLQNYRRCIGTVMQEDALLSGTLADNIAFFDAQKNVDRIRQCAQAAQLQEDISRMPMGYETLVGDLGSGLSGGQKQRVLLARALYKRPRVLALDEATSHLDLNSERAVVAELRQARLTRLIIAHRPETIAGAERVVQLMPTPFGARLLDIPRDIPPAVAKNHECEA